MIHDHRHMLDWSMWIFAALAGVLTLAKVALFLSCIAALVSIGCGAMKLYDRCKYGPDTLKPIERLKRHYDAMLADEQRRGVTEDEQELLDKLK